MDLGFRIEVIGRNFFEREPVVCARELVGATLVWGDCAGVIVETEAYDDEGDAACHTFFRPSAREFVEREPAGTAYIYLNYGVHWLLNVLVKGERRGFVLVRALEPIRGLNQMAERRGRDVSDVRSLCSGPGKLTQAIGIGRGEHGMDLCADPGRGFVAANERAKLVADGRIGISAGTELPWRFTLEGSRFVSRRAKVTRQDLPD
ncbi:MAG: DNA-3-methyladenine glycosylase [Chthoniobacterales bacterium]